jgi:hypothetical protein
MTADPPGTDDAAVASRLEALDGVATAEHLAVYTAIAGELAARLDRPDEPDEPDDQPKPNATADLDTRTGDRGGAGG